MGRGHFVDLSYTALVLLSAASSSSASTPSPANISKRCLWCVNIDESPAPAPQDGPPFSAHASRNPALIPYQVIGIVGAYVGSCLIIGSLLLTVGRSLRKRAQAMTARPTEMIKPINNTFDPSPISPNSERGWYQLRGKKSDSGSLRSGTGGGFGASPGMDSVVSFDHSVVEADRARRQEEMERLYAAVMADQDQRQHDQAQTVETAGQPPEYSRRNAPPRLVTDDPSLRHLQTSKEDSMSPGTPRSPVRAIYPPGSQIPAGTVSPTSPIRADLHNTPRSPEHFRKRGVDPRVNYEARTPSFGSARTQGSPSGSKKLRKSLRNLKISAPILKDDNSDGARTPLSPRYYTDPGVPPEPPTARTTGTLDSQTYPLSTPGTARTWQHGEDDISDDESIDEVRDLPQANPQRFSAYNYNHPAQQVTNIASTRPDPTKPSTATSTGTLPLREMNRQYASQQQQQQQQQHTTRVPTFPLSPRNWNAPPSASGALHTPHGQYMTSAGPVKTTFLEARRDRGGGVAGTPRTGMATPYSPYMPFTPVTPVTPHLTSRAERKQRLREERRARGAITEEDRVVEDGEMWGSGY